MSRMRTSSEPVEVELVQEETDRETESPEEGVPESSS